MKLIILNGPPGAGKSSVAVEIHKKLSSLSFLLKFDAQRRFLKDRHKYRQEAREFTYAICKSVIEECFKNKKDVVFEGVISDSYILEAIDELAQQYSAKTFEFILSTDMQTIISRNINRDLPADGLADSQPVTPAIAEKYWNKMNDLIPMRQNAISIDVSRNNLDKVINIVINTISD